MKLVSIIVPVYNSQKYLNKCIESLVNQTYKNIEVFLIDDGSSDESPQICDKWANIDNRINVIHQKNGGVSSARNCGLQHAKGYYISFVDSDDYLPENSIKVLLDNITDNDDLISGSYIIKKIKKKNLSNPDLIVYPNEKFTRFDEYDKTNWGNCGKLYKSSIIKENNILFNTKLSFGEDHIFNLNYVKHTNNNIVVINKPVYVYNNSIRNSLTSKPHIDMNFQQKALFEAILNFFGTDNISAEAKNNYLYNAIFSSIEHYVINYNKTKAQNKIEETFDIFENYISDDFLKSKFPKKMYKCINNKNSAEFYTLFLSKNIRYKKIKTKIKNLLRKILW